MIKPDNFSATDSECPSRERRQANWRSMFYALFMSRRKSRQLVSHTYNYYTDHYDSVTFLLAMLLIVLSVLDACFTLLLIQHGSVELNPFLSWFLHKHVLLFFLVKYFLTSLCIILTVMHGQFRIFGVKGIHFLTGSVVVYTFLIQYQLSMLLPF